MAALHIMLVLCHDFGAKRAFLLKAAGPAKLLIYFQDFQSFSSPGIRHFLTDLGTSSLPQPHFLLSSTLSTLPPPTSPPHPCFRTLVVLASAVCQLEPFQFLAHLHTHTHTRTVTQIYSLNMAHILSHADFSLSVESCEQPFLDFVFTVSKSQ